jgi:hypothetical protein
MADDHTVEVSWGLSMYKLTHCTPSNQDLGTGSYWWKSSTSNEACF